MSWFVVIAGVGGLLGFIAARWLLKLGPAGVIVLVIGAAFTVPGFLWLLFLGHSLDLAEDARQETRERVRANPPPYVGVERPIPDVSHEGTIYVALGCRDEEYTARRLPQFADVIPAACEEARPNAVYVTEELRCIGPWRFTGLEPPEVEQASYEKWQSDCKAAGVEEGRLAEKYADLLQAIKDADAPPPVPR